MAHNCGDVIYYLSKKEFKKRMHRFQKANIKAAKNYVKELAKEESKRNPDVRYSSWLKGQVDDLKLDIEANQKMLWRAEIEEGLLLYWTDSTGNLMMRRSTEEEYKEIYRPRNSRFYVV